MDQHENTGITRRSFLAVTAGLTSLAGIALPRGTCAAGTRGYATIIDLSLCDGCRDRQLPACVAACRDINLARMPEPVNPIPVPYPRRIIEDWSQKKDVTDRLTPYNLIFVEKVEVTWKGQRRTLFIPRRCMHCDNPACATICPFSANHKYEDGAVVINRNLCLGGAKCRTVCPWSIPQRQSGVGIYLHLLPTLAGNGVLFKCDLCHDLLARGETPGCIAACPRGALLIGERDQIYREARRRAAAMDGYIYGERENGGTATLYVSPVPFEKLNEVIPKGPGLPHLGPAARRMEETDLAGKFALIGAPLIGIIAGLAGALVPRADGRGKRKGE